MTEARRVLLLNPPGTKMYARDKYCASVSKADYYWPQVDLIFQSGYLSQRHKVAALDAIVEKLGPRDALRRIEYLKPDAVLFLTSSASWPEDLSFIGRAKSIVPFESVALGGWLLPLARPALEKFRFLDAVLLDFASDDLAQWLAGKRPVYNMAWREGDKIIEGERRGDDPFEVPTPHHELFPLDKYRFPLAKHRKFTVTNTAVGCPWKCRFCVPGTVKYRARSVENVIEELKAIKRLGVREILFHDATFTAVRSRATQILEAMIRERLELRWMCQTRADSVDRELLRLMKRAGCEGIEFGVESGSEKILSSIRKQITLSKTTAAFRMAREEGISTNAFFIIGMPEETEEDIEATISFAKSLNPTVASFSVPMPHPGTPLGDDEKTPERFLPEALRIDDVSPPKLTTGKITPERIFELRNRALRSFYLNPAYILRKFFELRSLNDFKRDATLAVSLFRGLLEARRRPEIREIRGHKTISAVELGIVSPDFECPLCGFGAEHYCMERGSRIMSCAHCKLLFVNPMPDEKELQGYYEGVHREIRPEVWSKHGERVRAEALQRLKERLPRGRVLDVGSGAGHFIEMLKGAGYDAYGIEPAAEISPRSPVLAHSIAEIPPDIELFDAITMFWVLEHIPNPDEAIAKIRELLKPGGILILRVPNMAFIRPIHRLKFIERLFPAFFERLINPASNKESFFELLGPPYHLYGYSAQTVTRLLAGHGFTVERIGIDGGLRTGKGLRDSLDTALRVIARAIHMLSGGRIIFFYDLTAWARKFPEPWQ